MALRHNVLLHVDACVGGMMLPFVRKLGYTIPDFDFAHSGRHVDLVPICTSTVTPPKARR